MYARKTTFVTKKSKEDKTRVAKVSKNGLQVGKSRKNNLKTPNKPIDKHEKRLQTHKSRLQPVQIGGFSGYSTLHTVVQLMRD